MGIIPTFLRSGTDLIQNAFPFDFMELISLTSKENFFEKRVSNYSMSSVGKTSEEMSFSLDMEF